MIHGGGKRRADGHLIQEVVGPLFGRASSESPHGVAVFLELGDDMIRDGVAFVLGQGVLEAAHDLARAA
jgi:hypothetical protein